MASEGWRAQLGDQETIRSLLDEQLPRRNSKLLKTMAKDGAMTPETIDMSLGLCSAGYGVRVDWVLPDYCPVDYIAYYRTGELKGILDGKDEPIAVPSLVQYFTARQPNQSPRVWDVTDPMSHGDHVVSALQSYDHYPYEGWVGYMPTLTWVSDLSPRTNRAHQEYHCLECLIDKEGPHLGPHQVEPGETGEPPLYPFEARRMAKQGPSFWEYPLTSLAPSWEVYPISPRQALVVSDFLRRFWSIPGTYYLAGWCDDHSADQDDVEVAEHQVDTVQDSWKTAWDGNPNNPVESLMEMALDGDHAQQIPGQETLDVAVEQEPDHEAMRAFRDSFVKMTEAAATVWRSLAKHDKALETTVPFEN